MEQKAGLFFVLDFPPGFGLSLEGNEIEIYAPVLERSRP